MLKLYNGIRYTASSIFRLIQQCVAMHPIPLHELVANPKPKNEKQEFAVPPNLRNKAPASLDISVPTHPWWMVLP